VQQYRTPENATELRCAERKFISLNIRRCS
jgi:hypothetical protein